MGRIWTDQAKYQSWLDVEIAACEANCHLGRVPQDAMQQIRQKASFEPERILEIEAEVKHDVIAFLTNVNEHVGHAGRYIHVGMTSSDVLDTGLALQLKASVSILRKEIKALEKLKTNKAPFTVILGGAKVSDKIGVILNLSSSELPKFA